jgi:hypothetical protein
MHIVVANHQISALAKRTGPFAIGLPQAKAPSAIETLRETQRFPEGVVRPLCVSIRHHGLALKGKAVNQGASPLFCGWDQTTACRVSFLGFIIHMVLDPKRIL